MSSHPPSSAPAAERGASAADAVPAAHPSPAPSSDSDSAETAPAPVPAPAPAPAPAQADGTISEAELLEALRKEGDDDAVEDDGPSSASAGATKRFRCRVCRKSQAKDALVPCGHMAVCHSCHAREVAAAIRDKTDVACPVCMSVVDVRGAAIAIGEGGRRVMDVVSTTVGWQWQAGLVPPDNARVLALYALHSDGHGGVVKLAEPLERTVAPAASSSSSSSSSAPPPSGPLKAHTVDPDKDWLGVFGPSVFHGKALGEQWSIFRNSESGALYYVETATGNHTWDCPPEVASELKVRALAAALDAYSYEGLGADFETNGPWVPPSPAKAKTYKAEKVFGGGRAPCCCFRDDDFAQLGVGVALYFRTLRSLACVFFLLTILSLPAWAFYSSGFRMLPSLPDPLRASRVSLGNLGPLTYEQAQTIVAARSTAALGNATLSTTNNASAALAALYSDPELNGYVYFSLPGTDIEVDGTTVGYVITAFDIGSMLVLLIAVAALRSSTEKFVAYSERKNVSASDYTIFVRGLPEDVTVEEIRDHFSMLFALDGSGVDAAGLWDPVKARSVQVVDPKQRRARGKKRGEAAFGSPVASPGLATPSAGAESSGSPTTPASPFLSGGSSGPSLSSSGASREMAELAAATELLAAGPAAVIPTAPKALKTAALAARKAIDGRRRYGIITDADPDVHFVHRIEAVGKGTVADIDHNGDTTFADSWVADISVTRPVAALLSAYLNAERLSEKLREARARVKMWSEGTPHKKGPNAHKRAAAMKQVDKLGSELATLRESLKRRNVSAGPEGSNTCVGSAFVTFNCEESMQRCLRAYRGSTSALLRPFQPPHLRVRCPAAPGFHALPGQEVLTDEKGGVDWKPWQKDTRSNHGRGYTLIVEKAPDPSDVIHENLAVTSLDRCIRQMCTGIVTALLVIAGLIMMIVAQSYSKTLAASTPDLTMCDTELPALFLGGYDNVTDARHAITDGYGLASNLKSSLDINSARRLHAAGDAAEVSAGSSSSSFFPASAALRGGPASAWEWPANDTRRSLVSASASFATNDLSRVVLSRLARSVDRAVEDAACPVGRVAIAYRYDFSDVPANDRGDYPSVPFGSSSSQGNAFTFGSAVPYATSSHVNSACDLSQAQTVVASVDPSLSPRNLLDTVCPDPRMVKGGTGYCACATPDTDRKCLTLPCFRPELEDDTHTCREFTASTVVGCYCVDVLNAYVEAKGAFDGFFAFTDRESDVCEAFITSYIQAQSLIIVSAAAASLVNVLLGLIIPALTSLEGHVSLSARSRALAVKVAAAQTINTGLTALLVNARLPDNAKVSVPAAVSAIGLFNGQFSDFSTPWYGVVGTTICTTALINALIPPVLMSAEYILDSCRRRSALRTPGSVVTQAAMDELYVGATFETPRRYPLIITMVSVSLMYSAGFPLLLPLAALGFLLQYSVDKIMILRFYRKPPAYDASMTWLLLSIVPYAVLAHLGFAAWMLSSPGTIPSVMLTPEVVNRILSSVGMGADDEDASTSFFVRYTELAGEYDSIGLLPRLLRLNIFPYFIFFLALLVILALSNVLFTLYTGSLALLRAITCGFICCAGRDSAMPARLKKATAKVMPSPDNPVIAAAMHALNEFRDHAIAYANLGAVRAGLLFEALFVRTVKADPGAEAHAGAWLALDGQSSGAGKGLAPFCEEFSRIHDAKAAGTSMTSGEVHAGWRLQEVDARTLDDIHGHVAAFEQAVLGAALASNIAPKGTKEILEGSPVKNYSAFSTRAAGSSPLSPSSSSESSGSASPSSPASPHHETVPAARLNTLRTKSHAFKSNPRLLPTHALLAAGVLDEDQLLSPNPAGAAPARHKGGVAPVHASVQGASVKAIGTAGVGGSAKVAPAMDVVVESAEDESDTEREGAKPTAASDKAPEGGGSAPAADIPTVAVVTLPPGSEPMTPLVQYEATHRAAGQEAAESDIGAQLMSEMEKEAREADEAAKIHPVTPAKGAWTGDGSATNASPANATTSSSPPSQPASSSVPEWGGAKGAGAGAGAGAVPGDAIASTAPAATKGTAGKAAEEAGKPKKKKKAAMFKRPTIFYLRKFHTADSVAIAQEVSDSSSPIPGSEGPKPGQAKRTWEVIKDAGLWSYDVKKNPRYTAAFAIATAGAAEDAEDDRISADADAARLRREAEEEAAELAAAGGATRWAATPSGMTADDDGEAGAAALV
jgi:RNA recognition motif-containing protein